VHLAFASTDLGTLQSLLPTDHRFRLEHRNACWIRSQLVNDRLRHHTSVAVPEVVVDIAPVPAHTWEHLSLADLVRMWANSLA